MYKLNKISKKTLEYLFQNGYNRTKETISFYTDKEMIDFFIQNLSDLNLININ